MKLFSQRKGLKPTKSAVQVDSIDDALRNGLWNALLLHYWRPIEDGRISEEKGWKILRRLWMDHFKRPVDEVIAPFFLGTRVKRIFAKCEWYEVYDLIEFMANQFPGESVNRQFIQFCNSLLERERSAYRFAGGRITQITSEVEISEMEEAIETSRPLKGVNAHLKTALDFLADRKSPDYRNSIKESISAVESLCRLVARNDKATLGQALKQIEDKVSTHPALKSAFSSLYGYTSDAEGIRHALLDEAKLDFEDAKFMLVSCSAFVNYLVAKAAKAGMPL